ncbi:hypothetical protein ElyMa_005568400 [Elysia marginata]|uniref:Uncharacterized protein n=1 Tax=Elysia marginata TaxID=1093978 RepID=A0AAV4F210_9GAST|nr:hypothetical protein ElyMa_005568400 [Elysia marginata]
MGRRARTNCSPVDSVLEKYHNDIGNRLSGVFIPPAITEGGQPLSDDFSMLTLDIRRSHSVKVKGQKSDQSAQTANTKKTNTDTSENTDLARSEIMPRSASPVPTDVGSEPEGAFRDKTRLVDKLTRALFQKKHVCARCKRKSRTCVLNKTLNVSEKRYTCGRCRENSSALKNFFDGQSGDNQEHSFFSSLSSSSSNNKREPQPRTGNDSGYETVTSCSTVASSYSAFNTPNSNNTSRKENLAPGCESRLPQELPQAGGQAGQNSTTMPGQFQQRCQCQDGESDTACSQFNTTENRDFRLPGPHDYDGYLPDFIEFRGWTRQLLRPCSQGDATADCDEDDDTDSGPNIICVRRPTSLDSSPKPARKACHTCGTTSVPCFRLPWEGGWLCEDCMDGIY